MKQLNLNDTVYSATQKYPELIDIIADLGFTQIRNKFLRNTLGKKYTLIQAIEQSGIKMEDIVKLLDSKGFSIVGA